MNELSPPTVMRAYAKVNLSLDILGAEDDGYHKIWSVAQTISLYDTVTLRAGDPGIRLVCDDPALPSDERNLAHRSASLFCAAAGIEPAFDIALRKRIPVQAGLGGGSSDAAAVLRGLDRTLDEPLSERELCAIGARIGSDVPFFLTGGTAVVGGYGEHVEPLPEIPELHLVIVKPPFGVSTAWAYGRLDEIRAHGESQHSERTYSSAMVERIHAGDWDRIPRLLANDLERPSIERHPELAEIKRALIRLGAGGSLMCGSGSAVFGIFGDERESRKAAEELRGYGSTFTARTIGRDSDEE